MDQTRSEDLFRPVKTGRVSEQIVDRISTAIRGGVFKIGDRLPAERVLTEQLNVSRVTLRDALRTLEARGLITIRVGSGGGAFVTAPGPQLVAEGMVDMLALSQITAPEVTEARQIFELAIIPTICERATDEDLAMLTSICDRSDAALANGTFDLALSAEFHVALARTTHNHAIELMAGALQGPMHASLEAAQAISPHRGDKGISEHREIIAAIASRDVEHAEAVMSEHLNRTARRLRTSTRARARSSRAR
jgi:GntR family transcriptional regulator, transcriptional repressor for pyruvate dehydrogenase complex